MRIFHIYSDGKRFKEISWEDYRKIPNPKSKRMKFLFLWNTELAIHHHNSSQYIRLAQLEAILNLYPKVEA